MGFRINRGIFQYKKDDGTFANKFMLDKDSGRIMEVDEDGNMTDGYLKLGEKASDSDKVDGKHANNSGGGIPVLNSNGYWNSPNWINIYGHGLYSSSMNGAHFLPNNQDHGSWKVLGSRNGWMGLHFGEGTGVTLMMNEAESGLYRKGSGWKFKHYQGKFFISTGTNGGGAEYEAYHKGNLTPVPYSTSQFFVGGDPETYYPVLLNKSSRTTGKFTIYRDNVHQDENGRGAGRLVLTGFTSGWGHVPLTLHYETKKSGTVLWKFLASNYRTGLMVVYLKGATTYYYKSEHGFTLHDGNSEGSEKSDGRTNWLPTKASDANAAWEGETPSVLTIKHGTLYHDAHIKAASLEGDGSLVSNVDAQTLDGVNSGSFLRSDADDTVSGHTEWQDSKEIRLGNGADFRMWHDGSHTYFRNYNHGNGNIYFQGEDAEGSNHALLYMFTANSRPYVSLYENGGERFKTKSNGVEVLGDAFINQGRIHIKRGTGLTHAEWEDDSSANGRAQLILDSHYSDLIIASRNANNNKHGSTLTLATQSTSTNDVAKWVIGQGQYQEGAHIMAFAYGVNHTNPHSVLGTDNANAEMLITNGAGVWSRNGFSGDLSGNASTATTATNLGAYYTADDWFRATGDNNHIKFYGNSRQMMWRTDGVTEAYAGLGGYPFVWNYNGSGSGNRIMLLATDGRLWTGRYGWLDTAFDAAGEAQAVQDNLDGLSGSLGSLALEDSVTISEVTGLQTALDGKLSTTGKAADSNLLDGVNSGRFVYGGNSTKTTNVSNFSTALSSGFYDGYNATGNPTSSWYTLINMRHNNTSNNYGSQIAVSFYSNADMYVRTISNGTYQGWSKIWNSANFDPASKLGATAKAADSDKLDGYDWMQGGKNVRGSEFYADNWFRNYNSGEGLYNQATGQHFYSDDDDYWNIAGGTAANGLRFRDEHDGTIRGYVYANSSNQVGFLDAGGSWAIRHYNDAGTDFYTDNSTLEFSVGRDRVSGNYGTVQTVTTRGGWGGYSINGQYVLMSNHGSDVGIYNDIDNEWMTRWYRNGKTELHYNGSAKLETTGLGVTVTGKLTATNFVGDGSGLTGIQVPGQAATISQGGEPVSVTVSSIDFNPDMQVITFTLSDGSSYQTPLMMGK